MKIPIDCITSVGIRNEMHRDSYQFAEFFGRFSHPLHPDSRDAEVKLYRAADSLVFETNGDPIWQDCTPDAFDAAVQEYGINLEEALKD
jgi:hypothetical protein